MSQESEVKRNGKGDRPVFKNKEQLETWINEQSILGKEYPWSEACWLDSVKHAEDVKKAKKEDPNIGGNYVKGVLVSKRATGRYTENPLTNYFCLRHLKQYSFDDKLTLKEEIQIKKEEIKQEYGIAVISSEKFTDCSEITDASKDTLWFENWINSFNAPEQAYLRSRFRNYMNDYEIVATADQSMFMQILATELLLYRLNLKIAKPTYDPTVNDTKLRETLSNQLKSFLSEQQWTQKSQGKKDNGETRFTSTMMKWYNEGYTTPDIIIEPDEIDLIMNDMRDAMENMRM